MSLNNVTGTTYSSALLIADTFTLPNGSNDSLPPFTKVNGFPVSACLELQSILGALLVSRMTTTQKLALTAANGMILYDTTLMDFQLYNNGWNGIPSVVIPTVVNDLPVFTNTAGAMKDSGIFAWQNASFNFFIGPSTGNTTLTGSRNIAVGSNNAASSLTACSDAVIIGYNAADSGADFSRSTIIGSQTATQVTAVAATDNVLVGYRAAFNATTLTDCVFIGSNTASSVNSNNLVQLIGIGSGALQNIHNGTVQNIAIGHLSCNALTTAENCTLIGFNAGNAITTAVLCGNTTGVGNEVFATATTSVGSTAIGSLAGFSQTQYTNCTFLGSQADALVNNLTNATAIGFGASVSASNSLILGNSVNVGIGTTAPQAQLHLTGSIIYNIRQINAGGGSINGNDYIIQYTAGGNDTLTLPVATTAVIGKVITIVCTNGGVGIGSPVLVNAAGGTLINGVPGFTIIQPDKRYDFVVTGSGSYNSMV